MTPEREHLLCNYLEKAKFTSATGPRVISAIIGFLNDADEITARGYRKYRKNYAIRFLNGESAYILGFLRSAGVRITSAPVQHTLDRKEPKPIPVDESEVSAFIVWLRDKYDYSEHTMRIYVTGLRQFLSFSRSLTNDSVRDYSRYLESKGLSPKTIHTRIVPLKLYAQYKKKNLVIKSPKIPRKLSCDNIPSEDEYQQLLIFLKGKREKKYYLWVRILATTGLRLSEFKDLRWCEVLSGQKYLRGKGNKYRTVYFQSTLIEEVKKYIPEDSYSQLVATSRFGLPLRNLRTSMQSWSKDTEIDKIKLHPHAFRHFFAKQYLKSNNDPIQLAEYLGHSSLDITRLYLQKSKEEQLADYSRNVNW